MLSVHQIAEEIVSREGGYVNDPDDPGGATKYGITLATWQRHGRDLTGNGRITAADVMEISRADAVAIMVAQYFHAPRIDQLPQVLQPSVFDMQVNAGGNAVKILQRLLTHLGYPLKDDGVIGPATIRAAHAAYADIPARLADAYGIARRDYYYALGDARPASRKYARRRDGGKGGWITRAEQFISPPFHLTEAQHRERTKAWG
jgi:lysozyme family protein